MNRPPWPARIGVMSRTYLFSYPNANANRCEVINKSIKRQVKLENTYMHGINDCAVFGVVSLRRTDRTCTYVSLL